MSIIFETNYLLHLMTAAQKYFEALIESTKDATLSNMFGKPCGKINKKAFCSFFEDEMVFKVGRVAIEKLIKKYEGAKNFDPSGKNRPMKDWLQVPYAHKKDWSKLSKQAIKFLAENS